MTNPAILKTILAIVTFMIIATQTINSWFFFDNFSRIENKKLRNFQSIMFCGIFSLFILVMVFMQEHKMALLGAVVEALLNVYYYFEFWWQNGYGSKQNRGLARIRFWRRYWFKVLLAFIIPAAIFGCSYFMTKL